MASVWVAAVPGSGQVSLTGASLAANGACVVTLKVTSVAFLNLTNTIPAGAISSQGGYTNAKFDVNNASGTVETNRDIDTDGRRLGAGVEQAISNKVFAKVEYRYSNYKEGELDYRSDFPDGDRFDLDLDRHQVMVGVGMRF